MLLRCIRGSDCGSCFRPMSEVCTEMEPVTGRLEHPSATCGGPAITVDAETGAVACGVTDAAGTAIPECERAGSQHE